MTAETAKTEQSPQTGALFETMRATFARVAAQAQHVTIVPDKLAALAAALPDTPVANALDTAYHYSGDDESLASYIVALDSVNFGSGYKPFLAQEGFRLREQSIYYTVSTLLKDHYETRGPLSATAMARMSRRGAAALFGLDLKGDYSHELAVLFSRALNQTGRMVLERYQGRFMGLIEDAQGSVERLVPILTGVPHFDDSHDYKGLRVAFHKRAQITAADLQVAFRHKGQSLFHDSAKLTMFADNAVPHVLRMAGVLQYAPALSEHVESGAVLPLGSAEEVEIRACAAHTVEKLAAIKGMTSMDIDHILWHRSAENPALRKRPAHRTLSWFY